MGSAPPWPDQGGSTSPRSGLGEGGPISSRYLSRPQSPLERESSTVFICADSAGERWSCTSPNLLIYRAKHTYNPRLDSELMVGRLIDAANLLCDLRINIGVDTALGLSNGPNSGLSAELVIPT